MSFLYVDVDDTLVTWLGGQEPHPYGQGAETWVWNMDVIECIRTWPGSVVIWSGGGQEYARVWRDRLYRDFDLPVQVYPFAKQNVNIVEGDVFIDDSPFDSFAPYTIHPRDLT